ncbi:MAG: CBS domain-containing protein [Lentisphaeraceae bacterium]|nr:CBS domain-containing protein [Lentisphaeraceae bacterium]
MILHEGDTEPSKIIILCLISKSTSNIYLLSLKAIYSYFSQDGVSEKVARCKSADELIELLNKDGVEVKHSITAEDIMMKDFPLMEESVVLGEAIDYFMTSNRNQVPVVDKQQKFIGSVSIESILKADIPKYVMMMDNLAFLSEFEPFEQLLAKEDEMPLTDFINRSPETCTRETPLMKIVVDLVKRKTNCFYVLDENKRLVGLISKRELIKNLLRR